MTDHRSLFLRHPGGARWLIRLAALAAAVVLGLPILPWRWLDALPALSPLTAALAALASREPGILALAGLPLAVLAFLRGRWFCFRLCPLGTLADLAALGRRPTGGPLLRGLSGGRWLLVAGLAGSALGWPLFLWLDPLAIFGGAVGALGTVPVSWRHGLGVLPLALVLAVSALWPRAWCDRLCPLGAAQLALGRLGFGARQLWLRRPAGASSPGGVDPARAEPPPAWVPLTRRDLLAACAGLAAGYALGRTGDPDGGGLIRPPGAGDEARLRRLCARCGRCFQACPRHVIHPDLGESGWTGFLTPHVVIGADYCGEWCHACCRVCPTGAIGRLSLEDKRRTMIGLAVVDHATCLAWADRQACMVCQEFCPYLAIRETEQNGVNCPVVDETRCRGCGACQTACPAIPAPAIRVRGLARQTLAPPVEADAI